MRRSAWMTAAALIVGPLLLGMLAFQLRAPGRGPGVYLDLTVRGIESMQALRADPSGATVPIAVTIPDGVPLGFVVVAANAQGAVDQAKGATLSLFVVDHADPAFHREPLPLPATMRVVDAVTFEVTHDALHQAWMPGRVAFDYFAQVLATTTGSRNTLAVVAVLDVPSAGPSTAEKFSVTLGPRTVPPRLIEVTR